MFALAAEAHETLLGRVPTDEEHPVLPRSRSNSKKVSTCKIFFFGLNGVSIPFIKSLLEVGEEIEVFCYVCNESVGTYAGVLTDSLDGGCKYNIDKQWTKETIFDMHKAKAAELPELESLSPQKIQEKTRAANNRNNLIIRDDPEKVRAGMEKFLKKTKKKDRKKTKETLQKVAAYISQEDVLAKEVKEFNLKGSMFHQELKEAELAEKQRIECAHMLFGAEAQLFPGYNPRDSLLQELRESKKKSESPKGKMAKSKTMKWEQEMSDHIPPSYCDRTFVVDKMIRSHFLDQRCHERFHTRFTLEGAKAMLQECNPKLIFFATEGEWSFSTFGKETINVVETLKTKLKNEPLVFVLPSWPLIALKKSHELFIKASIYFPLYVMYELKSYGRNIGYTDQRKTTFQKAVNEFMNYNKDYKTLKDRNGEFVVRYFEDEDSPICIEEGMDIRRDIAGFFKKHNLDVKVRRVGLRLDDSTASMTFFQKDSYSSYRKSVAKILTTPELYHVFLPLQLYICYVGILKSQPHYHEQISFRMASAARALKRKTIKKAMEEILYSSAHFHKNVTKVLTRIEAYLSSPEALSGIVTVLEELYGREHLLSDGNGSGSCLFENFLQFVKLRSELKRHVSNVEADRPKAEKLQNCRKMIANTKEVCMDFIHRGAVYSNGQYNIPHDPESFMELRNRRSAKPT